MGTEQALALNLRRVGVNAGWTLLGKGFGGVLSIVYLALATRTLGLADYGRFSLVVAIAQGMAGFAGFQTWQLVVRYAMPAHLAGDDTHVERVIFFATLLDLAAALVGSALAYAVIAAFGTRLGLPPHLHGATFAFCFVLLLAVRSTPTGILRLEDRFRDATFVDSVTPGLRMIGAGLAALFAPDVKGFLCAWAGAEAITAALAWRVALRRRRLAPSVAGLRRTLRDEPGLWRFVLAISVTSSLTMTTRQVTLLAVGAVAGPAAAGTFRLAAQLAQALAKLTQSFSRAAYPELVRSFAAGADGDRALLVRMTGWAAAVAVGMVALAAVAGEPILLLIAGAEFRGAYLPIVLLVGAAAFDMAGFAFEPAMTARGESGTLFWLRAAAAALQALLLLLLLPPLEVIGGAWATFGGSLAALALTGWGAFRRVRRAPASA
jgi:O-antigen/teichoic acid export membrane protein